MLRTILFSAAGLVLAAFLIAALATFILSKRIERRFPPVGTFVTVNGTKLHFVDEGPRDAPVILLIHGASSNLRDMLWPVRQTLGGRYRLIAVDRPGHGWSERGTGNATPDAQARLIGAFLDTLGVARAVVMGHSFGAAVATALAVERPDKVSGLLVAAPATHAWPSGTTNWYNHFAGVPVAGWMFIRTLALPAGIQRLERATDCVFSPNRKPGTYLDDTGIALVLTPLRFAANSVDLTGLHGHTVRYSHRYREIAAPTIVISGDSDNVVSKDIHSVQLAAAIPGAQLFVVPNVGHKPDYALAPLVAAALETLAGTPRDLGALARAAETELAGDAFGPLEACPPPYKAEAQPA
jgi:pimeloyl-ACP methyl ester carboxylesterase